MTISVQIHPSSPTLHMFNEPDASTAYSLSGHVSISISSSFSYFEKARAAKAILRSLTLTFEGYQELVTFETGYCATRLCTVTRELAPLDAMLLSADGQEDGKSAATWEFLFNVPIPGWLPPSAIFGSDMHGPAGTRYALFAEAKFASFGEGHARGWSLAALCSSITHRDRVMHAKRCDIELVRFAQPEVEFNPDTGRLFGDSTFMIDSHSEAVVRPNDDPLKIPIEILQKIEVLATVPEVVAVDSDDIRLAVRLRASSLPLEQQQRLKLVDFEIKLSQTEHFHKSPQNAYAATFPLPEESMQIESIPLRNPHPMKSMYDIGLVTPSVLDEDAEAFTTSFSILPPRHSGRHKLPSGGVSFAHDATNAAENAWCKLEVAVPFSHVAMGDDSDWERRHGRVKALRPTHETPLFCVHHELEVDLTCTYDSVEEGAKPGVERLVFGVPVIFAYVPPQRTLCAKQSLAPPADSPLSSRAPSPAPSTSSRSPGDFNSLPAYSQLFHSNGDRKINYSIPLPLYTPDPSMPPNAPPYEPSSVSDAKL